MEEPGETLTGLCAGQRVLLMNVPPWVPKSMQYMLPFLLCQTKAAWPLDTEASSMNKTLHASLVGGLGVPWVTRT